MRGIVCIGGEGPPPEFLQRLAAGADLIVAADSGLMALEDAGVSAHWIVGDMDSLDDAGRLEKYPPERVLRYPEDKDYTDTELGLKLLFEQGCQETWIAGGGGGRIDHLLAIRSLFERDRAPSRWITARDDICCIENGAGLSRHPAPGTLVSVFPLGPGPWKARSAGLTWPLDDLPWNRGFFGISNRAERGDFSVTAEKGRFLLVLPLDLP
ncbi:thiamine diphosphokinase [Breznakiella homolactica]|uniref:Thiamine diphosphokinase n=1 Tax=Breznakiella homolactica TaxID=2798577 RepID=A0A7T7XKL0_9SPIR|nr:thiamine diphosphokinase [Breznakiella homolactica]QQO08145.1 thiamine diphosphokinase [Breznakiella homolactica]